MSKRKVNLVVVCEDIQQEAFVRRYLAKRGFDKRRIYVRKSPAGKGSGEQFVREQLSKEVREFRRRSSYQEGVALVAVIDADTLSVNTRLTQINSALVGEGLAEIRTDERIAVFIPKRNIETWIQFARDRTVNEETLYPKLKTPSSCKEEVNLYVDTICRGGIPDDALPSLVHACNELDKILGMVQKRTHASNSTFTIE